jgi:phosphohistidine phosphatase
MPKAKSATTPGIEAGIQDRPDEAAHALLRLTLVRHAEAESPLPKQRDSDRKLKPRGQREAIEMAARLKRDQRLPDKILASNAARTSATARLLLDELGLAEDSIELDERLYLAPAELILQVAQERGGSAAHLMIVGHNPGLSEFADELSSASSAQNLPTCATYSLQFDIRRWPELAWASGINAELDYPSKS